MSSQDKRQQTGQGPMGYQQKSDQDDIVAIVAKGPTASQFSANADTQARSLHLRNPRTNEEMFIQLKNRNDAGQQQTTSGRQQSTGATGQETWEVITSKNI